MKFQDFLENKQQEEAEGLWKANGEIVRAGYLRNFPNKEKLVKLKWKDLPEDAKQYAIKDMNTRSPFKEQ
jgi:hypothetical protein